MFLNAEVDVSGPAASPGKATGQLPTGESGDRVVKGRTDRLEGQCGSCESSFSASFLAPGETELDSSVTSWQLLFLLSLCTVSRCGLRTAQSELITAPYVRGYFSEKGDRRAERILALEQANFTSRPVPATS